MRVLSQRSLKTPLVLFLILSVIVGSVAVARFGKSVTSAGPLDLAGVNNFAILVNTYTNAGPGTILNGDLGYTVPPANPPTVTGTTFTSTSPTYVSAEAIQAKLIASANDPAQSGACTTTLTAATVLDSLPQPLTPGVYCIAGAVSVNTVTTLSGDGAYIFRMGGALNTVAGSIVELAGNAKADNVGLVAIIDSSAVKTGVVGSYLVTYDAVDPAGNHATQVTRIVSVVAIVSTPSAAVITLSGQASCQTLGGTWTSASSTCTVTTLTINSGNTLVIASNVTLSNTGLVTDLGTITNGGPVTNSGTITIGPTGILTTTNTFSNTGTITSSGTITNNGPVTNGLTGTITSSGLITNTLTGTITNLGTITNSGPVTNAGTITNSGTLTNSGPITNSGHIINSAAITNSAVITNSGSISDSCGGSIGGVVVGNPIINACVP